MRFVSRCLSGPLPLRPADRLKVFQALALSCLLSSVLLCLAPDARAQYGVTYSGGQWTDSAGANHGDGPTHGSIFPGSWGVGVGVPAQTGTGDPQSVGGDTQIVRQRPRRGRPPSPRPVGVVRPMVTDPNSDRLSASGTITATVHWGGTDPPPQVAIEEEDCAVSWSGGAGTTGSCANPLGGTPVTLSPGQSCRFSKFTVVSGQTDITAACEPKASVTVPHYVGGAIAVEYRVSVTPVTVGLGGVNTDDPNSIKALTGQKITASLLGLPAGAIVSSYTWTVGGDAFKTYNENAASNQLVRLTAADLTGPPAGQTGMGGVAFYDKTAESLTVTCSATFSVPDGGSASVNPSSKQITVLKPTASWGITPGYVYLNSQNVTGFYGSPGALVYKDGQNWHDVLVTVPTPFSGGSFCFAQLVTPDRKVYRNLPTGSTASAYYQLLGNGVTALDGGFPYGSTYPVSSSPSGLLDGDSPVLAVPGANISVSVTDGGGSDWYKSSGSDQLQTWLMYQPPGGKWVPLQKYSWNWAGEQDIVTGTWICVCGDPLNPPAYSATATNDPPQWSSILAGGQLGPP